MENNKVLHLYPIDFPFETLVSRVDSIPAKLILNPDFQRTYKWDKDGNERASRFIESCLMRIPIPACYFAENQDSSHLVIDGVQRITTIKNFFNDEFALEGLTVFKELEGKRFSELGSYKSELETTTIRCIILRKENPKFLVQEIFARLNQGAVELSNQEIRHAIFPGSFNDLLISLAKNEIISKFGIGKAGTKEKNSREGEEMILRFFAMQSDLNDFEDNISKYLDCFMEKNQSIEEQEIEKMKVQFEATLDKCISVFSIENIFIDTNKDKQKQSILYYDLLMWSFKGYDKKELTDKAVNIRDAFSLLCRDEVFIKTISGGLAKKASILKRRKLWSKYLEDAIKA